ncbi:60S ribosomal protein L27a-like [Apodemus sylvaticus]|uniref:60S ribosomal protein L27a-like n=1 Tax=Apodemus sylvaticus TaxID=10129 RepID=UPI0022432222|nr:60S ribosomal protein L27a-like [Apodemus sylvaticus]
MPSRLRKTRALRGHVSQGHGHGGKQHKPPGGCRKAGTLEGCEPPRRISGDKYHPGYLGKAGMRHYHLKRDQSFCPTLNLDKLWMLVSEQMRVNAANHKPGAAPVTDAVRSSKGNLPK